MFRTAATTRALGAAVALSAFISGICSDNRLVFIGNEKTGGKEKFYRTDPRTPGKRHGNIFFLFFSFFFILSFYRREEYLSISGGHSVRGGWGRGEGK